MSRERVGQDFVIVQRSENQGLQTPEEQLDAEIKRIVDETWDLYLDVAEHEPDIDMPSLLTLNTFDDEDRESMAEIVEETVSETIYTWVDNPSQPPASDKFALVMAFLGIENTQQLRKDIPIYDSLLLAYAGYAEEQSRLALAASENPAAEDTVLPNTPEWPGEPDPDDFPVPAPKPRILH